MLPENTKKEVEDKIEAIVYGVNKRLKEIQSDHEELMRLMRKKTKMENESK